MRKSWFALLLLAATFQAVFGQTKGGTQDLTSLGLEDLMKIQVTTASKSAEAVSKVPSAIFVITHEMIRRSGAQNIPDALRLAPGVMVSQISSSQWEVTIRGFNNRFADKLLVLVDGRSVYTPDFSGVYWDELDMPMDDIDRIEVIRGPGGSLWGANAMNGVVNVITKHAADTLGNQVTAEGGSLNPFVGSIENGQKLAKDEYLRIFAKYSDNGAFNLKPGVLGPDEWTSAVAGFRFDSGNVDNNLMVEARGQSSHEGEQTVIPSFSAPYATLQDNRYPVWDGDILARWERTLSNGLSHHLQGSFTQDERDFPEADLQRTTINLDYQVQLPPVAKNKITLGAGYRNSPDRLSAGDMVAFTPEERTEVIASGFVHDKWQFSSDAAVLFGSKFERDNFDQQWEFEPNAQLLYTPREDRTWWASWSRAVRSPARADENSDIDYEVTPGPGGVPVLLHFVGNQDFQAETVSAMEAGYRAQATKALFVDVAAYNDEYSNLRSVEPLGETEIMAPVPYIEANYTFANQMRGETDGLELAGTWKAAPNWRLNTVYSYFTERLRLDPGSQDPLGLYTQDGRGGAIRHQFQVRSEWDLHRRLEFDANVFYYDASISGQSPPYWRADLRLGWKPVKGTTLSAGVQNLLQPYHLEAIDSLFTTSEEIPRNFYLEAKWKF
jgi:iron complex outermembrane receptor protein